MSGGTHAREDAKSCGQCPCSQGDEPLFTFCHDRHPRSLWFSRRLTTSEATVNACSPAWYMPAGLRVGAAGRLQVNGLQASRNAFGSLDEHGRDGRRLRFVRSARPRKAMRCSLVQGLDERARRGFIRAIDTADHEQLERVSFLLIVRQRQLQDRVAFLHLLNVMRGAGGFHFVVEDV